MVGGEGRELGGNEVFMMKSMMKSFLFSCREVLDFPMVRSGTCFRYQGVRRRTIILF